MPDLNAVLAAADAGREGAIERLFAILRIPSISTDPAHAGDCRRAADHIVAMLADLGFDASRRDTPGHPMVVAHSHGTGPRRLFYGHYDVQPADPLHLWAGDPFEPQMLDGPAGKMIRARGASDDKGQFMTFIEACRAWKTATGSLPGPLTIFLEGEEESGSPSLVPFLRENRDELTCDLALVCDTTMWDRETPSICTSLRGLLGEEIVITAASRDLHSGGYGGPAANPIRILARILASLHDDTGRVTLPGFYDAVPEIDTAKRAQWENLAFDEAAFLDAVGLATPAGEQGRSTLEMLWSRPTCEFNGIAGGYAGDGFKTVLPGEARAKVSFRLVGQQDPLAIREAFRAHVRSMVPPDCSVAFHDHGAAPATVMPTDAPAFAAARRALSEEWGKEAVFTGGGGSIPVAGYFKTELGMDSLLAGFSRQDNANHSPNEKYDLDSFEKGTRSWCRILAALG